MKIVVVNCSLNADSRSFLMAESAIDKLDDVVVKSRLVDLRELMLPLCDATAARQRPDVRTLAATIQRASAVVLAVPIYHGDTCAAARNLIEVTGRAWNDKIVALMCSGGDKSSHMAVTHLASQLMLEFRCLIVPRLVYATKDDFSRNAIVSGDLTSRIREMCRTTVRIAQALGADAGDKTGAASDYVLK